MTTRYTQVDAMNTMRSSYSPLSILRWVVLAVAALSLVSCGGGGGGSYISSVKVFGDSLADSGAFKNLAGIRIFSVQGSDSEPNVIWSEQVAKAKNIVAVSGGGSLCNVYVATSDKTFTSNSVAGCTSYAVGGGRINETSLPTTPYSIVQQLSDAKSNLYADDLVLIDGGGNDMADVVSAYLLASQGQTATLTGLLATIPNSNYSSLIASGQSAQAIGLYMQGLADKLIDAIKTNAIDRGVRRVVVANMPDVTLTPRLARVIAALGSNGAALQGAVQAWEQAYNSRLSSRASAIGEQILVVDLYGFFQKQVTSSVYSNVKDPACPATGADSGGATYNFATCTATALSAMQPSNPSWWTTYLFSDHFHPTPLAHRHFADAVLTAMSARGW